MWLTLTQNSNKESLCVSNAVVVGDGLDAALSADNDIRDHGKRYLEALRTNFATGCTSILDIARISSKFDPFESQFSAFDRYIKTILSSPFFTVVKFEDTLHHRKEQNWDSAVNAIVDLYDGVQDRDKYRIKGSLANLVRSVATRENIKNAQTLFMQTVLNVTPDHVEAYLYSSHIELEHSISKALDAKQIDISIKRLDLRFNKDLWYEHAPLVSKKQLSLISDWIGQNSLPEVVDPPALCIN